LILILFPFIFALGILFEAQKEWYLHKRVSFGKTVGDGGTGYKLSADVRSNPLPPVNFTISVLLVSYNKTIGICDIKKEIFCTDGLSY